MPKYFATLFIRGGGINIKLHLPFISGHSGHKGTNQKANYQVLKKTRFEPFKTIFTGQDNYMMKIKCLNLYC